MSLKYSLSRIPEGQNFQPLVWVRGYVKEIELDDHERWAELLVWKNVYCSRYGYVQKIVLNECEE